MSTSLQANNAQLHSRYMGIYVTGCLPLTFQMSPGSLTLSLIWQMQVYMCAIPVQPGRILLYWNIPVNVCKYDLRSWEETVCGF